MSKKDIEAVVSGFSVKTLTATQGKSEEDAGSIKLALIGSKAEIKVNDVGGQLNVSDVMAALNSSQECQSTVDIKLIFTVSDELYKQISDMRGGRKPSM